jgi:uncharacterized membrane protein YfcA
VSLPFSDVPLWQAAFLPAFSFAVGVLGGFVGLALGTMRLPVLLLLGFDAATAAGTNIAVSTATAASGSIRHLRAGRVDKDAVLLVGLPSMAGAFVAGFASESVPEALLLGAAGVLVFWQGVELLARGRHHAAAGYAAESAEESEQVSAQIGHRRGRRFAAATSGLAIGALGGGVGLILGSLRLPALIRVLRMAPRSAVGTNMTIGFAMGSVGWIGHVSGGHVDYPIMVMMASTAVVGSYIGAELTGRVTLERLIMTLGVVLLAVGPILMWRGVM